MLWVLGELMHIDDVRNAAQFVQRVQRRPTFDMYLQVPQEEDGAPHQEQRIHSCDASLNQVGETTRD
ncbi:MAG: hypothetical protein ACRDGN_00245 [bacterium]